MFFLSYLKIKKSKGLWTFLLATFVIIAMLLLRYQEKGDKRRPIHSRPRVVQDILTRFEKELNRSRFASFDNKVGAPNGELIVPNIVHFIVFKYPIISFAHFICILAAMRNQRPEKIYFHTNLAKFEGQYWVRLKSLKQFTDILVIKKTEIPKEIFNQTIRSDWDVYHGGDVARMRLLMEYGGIYLDNDSYVVRSLDVFRKFEMTIGWEKDIAFGNMVILAHKEARFLRLWYHSYDGAYDTNRWYYNAAQLPTMTILNKRPDLVHRVKRLFGYDRFHLKVFQEYWPQWRKHYAFHLMSRHTYLLHNISDVATYPVEFNEYNLQKYPITFKEMANEVLGYEKSLRLAKND